jgi:chromosome segregation ATPase
MEKTLEERVVLLEAAYNFVGKELTGLNSRVEGLRQEMVGLNNRMDTLHGRMDTLHDRVDDLRTDLGGRLEKLEQANINLQNQAGGLQQGFSELRTEVGKLANLPNQVGELQQGLSDLRNELKGDIGKLDSKLDAKTDKVFYTIVGGFLIAIVASLLTR